MKRRGWVVAALIVPAVVLSVVVWQQVSSNTFYYLFPEEAIERRPEMADGERLQLGGFVVAGSVVDNGTSLTFDVTDFAATITVVTTAAPPQLFREEIGVILPGYWEGDLFRADQVIIRHDEQYRVPDGYEQERP